MKRIITTLLILGAILPAFSQTKNITVRFNGGYGSIIDSIQVGSKMYYPGSLIKVTNPTTTTMNVFITLDNNEEGTTILQLYTDNKATLQTITVDNAHLHMGARSTQAYFSEINITTLESIVLIDNSKP